MRFVGEPFIFSFTEVAEGPSLIGPNAAVSANNRVYFMDAGGFYATQVLQKKYHAQY